MGRRWGSAHYNAEGLNLGGVSRPRYCDLATDAKVHDIHGVHDAQVWPQLNLQSVQEHIIHPCRLPQRI